MTVCSLPGCTRPVHVDAITNTAHDFCGRSHANEARQEATGQPLGPPHGNCHLCKYPDCDALAYFDEKTGRVHDYCTISHAKEAVRQGLAAPSLKARQGQGQVGHVCSLPGCSAPRYFDEASGREHDFCGKTHALKAEDRGVEAVPAGPLSEHVSAVWKGRQGEQPFTISVLTRAHPKFAGVKEQFALSWAHPTPVPTVLRVLQIRNAEPIYRRYVEYVAAGRG